MDRLNDLKRGAKIDDVEIDVDESEKFIDKDGAKGSSIQDFFKKVEIVKHSIVSIRDVTKHIVEINQELILSTTEAQEESASQGLQELIATGTKGAKVAQKLLKDLNAEITTLENDGAPAADLRVRKNLVQTLTKKYIDVLKEYQNVQNKSKEVKKKRAVKRVQQIKPDATPEEIEAVIKQGSAGELMKQAILQGDAADVVRNAYENVSNKYQDVLKLEASVAELAQMFKDFALIVEQQGELLDQIEYQVKAASEYIDQGNENMEEAIDIQKSIRKKQCICAAVVIVVIIIIVLVCYFELNKVGAVSSTTSSPVSSPAASPVASPVMSSTTLPIASPTLAPSSKFSSVLRGYQRGKWCWSRCFLRLFTSWDLNVRTNPWYFGDSICHVNGCFNLVRIIMVDDLVLSLLPCVLCVNGI